jgi:phosphatidylserine/phosphatidylglycerophosphate/cardiolipin synthase-like enzyme
MTMKSSPPKDDPGASEKSGPPPAPGAARPKRLWRRTRARLLLACCLVYLGVAFYQTQLKPLPAGLSMESEPVAAGSEDIEFLCDVTGMKGGERVMQQMIYDRALGLIREAQDLIVVDLFLFNPYTGKDTSTYRKLCQEVTDALLERKRSRPQIHIIVITDPVNKAYGGPLPEHLQTLQAAGIPVVFTALGRLRDGNPIYSSFWRIFVQWFGEAKSGELPHPFAKDAGGVGVRSWLALLNFKANHRKLVVADAPKPEGGRELVSLVMSANPHDASSAHGNVGLFVRGGIWRDLLRGEQAVLALSGSDINLSEFIPAYAPVSTLPHSAAQTNLTVQVLTEGKIRHGIVQAINRAGSGDALDLAMFYLSERSIVDALLAAARRGVTIRVLLDPNRDAFGYQKRGIPNRPVAAELIKNGRGQITVRWCDTHGEQFHSKLLLVKQRGKTTLIAGSANATRRNIGDLNLETDLAIAGEPSAPAFEKAADYFGRLWTNRDLNCSVPYETYAETSRLKYWEYRFKEWSGASSF